MNKTRVAVLGATGMIGQRFVQMLEDHPYFDIEGLYASERSEGKKLRDVLKVRDHCFREETLEREIEVMDLDKISSAARVAFSGIPSELAGHTESALAESGVAVFTNAGAHRMDPDVPILIPEVNPGHLRSVTGQKSYAESGGFIVTNANCSTTGIALPLKAIDAKYGLEDVFVSTYQALSGAGYPGVPSLDAVGNIVPFIKGEEEKMETELCKMLGVFDGNAFRFANIRLMANCARVPVVDGHTESLVLALRDAPSLGELGEALSGFRGEPQMLGLPSAPDMPVIVRNEENRPQPVFDVYAGTPERARGMAVTVGRLRSSNGYYKAFVLSHNTIRGGAGGSVLNAELAKAKGLL
jgi:aspartate-semialdehyde dehydrogenase